MKVYYRPINNGETFCTSIKKSKSVFQNTEIKLCFGEFSKQYNPCKNEIGYAYYKRNIFGIVVAETVLQPGVECPLLSFYVVKSKDFTDELKEKFQNDILYQLLEIYKQFILKDYYSQKDTVIWVEWVNDKFTIHKFVV